MTNSEKYLKDGETGNFVQAFSCWYYGITRELENADKMLVQFLKAESKPTLTEDERVILRNLRYEKGAYEYTKIGRTELDSEGNCDLILIDSDNESVWWGEYGHLFQFIKERRRI